MFKGSLKKRCAQFVGLSLLLLAILCGAMADGYAGTPQLVRNINTLIIPQDSYPKALGMFAGKFLFGATDSAGPGLWSTDGTAQGTTLVKRLGGSGVFVSPERINFIALGSRGYFVADDGATGLELWSTDGTTAGTSEVIDLRVGPNGSLPTIKGILGAQLIFMASDASDIQQMYASDGTAAGTHVLTAFSGQNSGVREEFLIIASTFYFVGADTPSTRQIYVSDGTLAGTVQINSFSPNNSIAANALYNPHSFSLVGSSILYMSSGLLWSLDTNTNTVTAVTAASGMPGFGPPRVIESANLVNVGSFVMFMAEGAAFASIDLWRSDGTTAGTYLIGAINPGPASFNAMQYPIFQKLGNKVVYVAEDGQHGPQLWSSDGTATNTVRLTNATQPANSSFQIVVPVSTIAGVGYFVISDGSNTTTWSIWRTDGTPGGTYRVTGIPALDQSEAGVVRAAGHESAVFFTTVDPAGSSALYKYDPAVDRSTLLQSSLAIYGNEMYFFDQGNLYFSGHDAVIGSEPWFTDGTVLGTHNIKDLKPQTTDVGSAPNEFVDFGGKLVFAADDGIHGRELWISDGTDQGTELLVDVNPGSSGSDPNHLSVMNGDLFFFAKDSTGASKFMRLASQGSSPEILATLSPLPPRSAFSPQLCAADAPLVVGGTIYFVASDGQSGYELWASDGTASDTRLVADIAPGGADAIPCGLTAFRDRIYFSAYGPLGNELWASDGTTRGTAQIADIAPGASSSSPTSLMVFNGALYFRADDTVNGAELWKSDGTGAGTVMVKDIVAGAGSSYATPLAALSGMLVFGVLVPASQQPLASVGELWVTDGSAQNTTRLAAVEFGPSSPVLVNGNQLYFVGNDAAGIEPWISDGSAAGTHILKDINGSGDSNPAWFENFRGVTLFEVTDPIRGVQIWRTDGTNAGTALVSDASAGSNSPISYLSARHLLAVGQSFFFIGDDQVSGTELYALANSAPTTAADSATSGGEAVTIAVLANDSDSDGTLNANSIRISSAPAHGSVVPSGGGLIYTPSPGFSGADSFMYTVDDNQGATSKPTTVNVTITSTVTVAGTRTGGGGSIDIGQLLLLLSLFLLYRAARVRA